MLGALLALGLLLLAQPAASAEELAERAGVGALYESLDREAQQLLDGLGAGQGMVTEGISGRGMFDALSKLVREGLASPLKALAALAAICLLARLCGCFEEGELGDTARLAGAAACGLVIAPPVLGLLSACARVSEGAAAFLGAAAPVYAGLLGASGSVATGSGYSFLAMLAGEAIPVLAAGLLLPLMRIYLALAAASAVSGSGLDRLTASLFAFGKWALVTAVTIYAGVLSVQTAVNGQVDAAANKAAKLALSTGVPIVGGALGDAAAAIQNSVQIVKSGAGAFGMLAAVCLFAPALVECLLWSAVCAAGQTVAELLELRQAGAMLGAFGGTVKMILAVFASLCAVCIATAAAIVFVRSGG